MRKLDSLGPVSQKILLLLLGGIALGFTRSPRQFFRIIKNIEHDWKIIDRRKLYYSLNNLEHSKLIEMLDRKDGSVTAVLTRRGRQKALIYKLDEISVPKMQKWDGKWRIILFDIPEKHKKARDALTRTLKRMDFYQFQKSVFIHPFECRSEVDFVTNFFGISLYVKILIAESIDGEGKIRKNFNL